MVNDDEVVLLFYKTFERRLRGPRHAEPEAGLLTRPAEAITLTVFFGKN